MFSHPDFIGTRSRIEVKRSLAEAKEVSELLVGFGFRTFVECHCGFWLVHWTFPRLRRIK